MIDCHANFGAVANCTLGELRRLGSAGLTNLRATVARYRGLYLCQNPVNQRNTPKHAVQAQPRGAAANAVVAKGVTRWALKQKGSKESWKEIWR